MVNSHYDLVNSQWISAYAHTYKTVAFNDKKSIFNNLKATMTLVAISSYNFLKYNHFVPLFALKKYFRLIRKSFKTKNKKSIT